MTKAALDHLNDLEFEEAWTYLKEQIACTLTKVCDEWIDKGWIDESDKKRALDDWDNDFIDVLPSLLG